MLKKGFSIELIAEVTKLDEKEILDLKRTLKGKEKRSVGCFVFLWTF